ncbi:MAG TPA: hypothetical protein VGI84_07750 [Pseudonocardiaceae bacterium]|jgi:hypothetical protein
MPGEDERLVPREQIGFRAIVDFGHITPQCCGCPKNAAHHL